LAANARQQLLLDNSW